MLDDGGLVTVPILDQAYCKFSIFSSGHVIMDSRTAQDSRPAQESGHSRPAKDSGHSRSAQESGQVWPLYGEDWRLRRSGFSTSQLFSMH